jgi:hypothetical protein
VEISDLMKCRKCKGQLEVLRVCRKICMQCKECGKEYLIHEIVQELDKETEELLSRYTSLIYD